MGSLLRNGDGCDFAYDGDAVERLGAAQARVSTAMPPRAEPYGAAATRPWLEGLLPQGRRRLKLSRELGLEAGDGYGLIAELGGDCPGAVTFLRAGDESPPSSDGPAWLGEEELEEALGTPLPRLGDGEGPRWMRFALPGRRHKLAFVRDEEGDRWGWPGPGAPSTHVVKPDPPHRPGLAALEVACTHAYRAAGLIVAHAEVVEIAGVECLVSKRFDRWQQADGGVERLHQESFTQALGIAPGDGEGRLVPGAPTLAEAAGLLRALGDEAAVESLLVAAAADVWLGHTEPRAAGAALLFAGGKPALAPFCDLAATEIYGDVRVRPVVVGDDAPPAPVLLDLIQVVRQCGVEDQPGIIMAMEQMRALSGGLGAAAERAQEEGWYRRAIDEALQPALERIQRFILREVKYLAPPGADVPPWMSE